MPPRGVKPGTKRARQYEAIRESELDQGAGESRAEEIAARTVNKARARSGESRTSSKPSTEDISAAEVCAPARTDRRAGPATSSTPRPGGSTSTDDRR